MSSFIENDPGTFLLTILDNVGLSVAVIDEHENIAYANKKARTMWGEHLVPGVSFAQWRGSCRFHDSHGRSVPIESALVPRALKGEKIPPSDFRLTLPDGSVKWMHETIERFSVFGITGLLVILSDETEAVLLRRAMQQFEQMGLLVQLTRGMVHDLNNMFSVVSESLYLARRNERIPQSTGEHLQQIEQALKKGISLVKKLGQFSRAEEFESKPFEINHAVNTATELARPLFGSRIRVKLALAPDLPVVEGDSGEIEQALVNLILNAVDAMPNGGEISLSTELKKRETHSRSGEKSGWFVLVTVADTGVGIPEEIQPKIFKPFFTTKPEKHGTGLGLASVYGIVQHHEGEIKVHSVLGEGTRFTIYLPVREPAVHQYRTAS